MSEVKILKLKTDQFDSRYVKKSGDTMTGSLNMGQNEIILKDSNNVEWKITIDTTGNIITTEV